MGFQQAAIKVERQQEFETLKSAIERTTLLKTLEVKISELDVAHSSLKDVQSRLLRAFL